ncbi:hypothetical protein WN51_11381 [Melipona quadrifasciata]|uniref:Uncharacterized protein n=1 Tax=Melipona quadrifasciata TaxID=166423 RepID=A0A0N0U759_9HYME|nr:hypothetical protein WN51_11381 [Melipona quadrifasciata]
MTRVAVSEYGGGVIVTGRYKTTKWGVTAVTATVEVRRTRERMARDLVIAQHFLPDLWILLHLPYNRFQFKIQKLAARVEKIFHSQINGVCQGLGLVDCTNRDFLGFQQIVASNSLRPAPVHLTTNGGYTCQKRHLEMYNLEFIQVKLQESLLKQVIVYTRSPVSSLINVAEKCHSTDSEGRVNSNDTTKTHGQINQPDCHSIHEQMIQHFDWLRNYKQYFPPAKGRCYQESPQT